MEIFLPENPAAIQEKIAHRMTTKNHNLLGRTDIKSVSSDLRRSILGDDGDRPVILTGHQPIFYTPGILMKDLLADAVARESGGHALNIIVDTDEEEISFTSPDLKNNRLIKNRLDLNRTGVPLKFQKLAAERKNRMHRMLGDLELRMSAIVSPAVTGQVRKWISRTKDIVSDSEMVLDPGVRLREAWERENSVRLTSIYASDLVKSRAFSVFVKMIQDNSTAFRAAYNQALHDYRKEHRIKNMAQPLPDLDGETGELPFWAIMGERRTPFTEFMDPDRYDIYPRAVAMTLFCRIFLCDLFIHGRGGGRYDLITDRIFTEFFDCEAAPFSVASATLAVESRADYAVESRSRFEILRDLRAFQFDPTRFLSPQHSIRLEKEEQIKVFHENPAKRPILHRAFMDLNQRAQSELQGLKRALEEEKIRMNCVAENNAVFCDRNYPFFFYNLQPLMEAVKPYKRIESKKPVPAQAG